MIVLVLKIQFLVVQIQMQITMIQMQQKQMLHVNILVVRIYGEITTLLQLDGGTWQGEISWQIYDDEGNMVANGGAPYSNEICLLDDMCYTIEMQDSFGDGWNGNIMTIGDFTTSLYAGSCWY